MKEHNDVSIASNHFTTRNNFNHFFNRRNSAIYMCVIHFYMLKHNLCFLLHQQYDCNLDVIHRQQFIIENHKFDIL